MQKDGDISDDVTHSIRAGWVKWKSAIDILCDKRIPLKVNFIG